MAAATDFSISLPPESQNMGSSANNDTLNSPPATMSGGVDHEAAATDTAGLASPTGTTGSSELPKPVQEVLQSEIGIPTMLGRLKQSITTAKEFSTFLKKRAQLEEEYASGMRKLARMTQDNMARNDYSQDTFGNAFTEMMDIHARMADNGYQFSMSLHQMHEDLVELTSITEKSRKGWKQTGLAAEQRVVDLETATRKSKAKYDSLAEEYDRVRTGDVGGRRGGFGFKGPKSAAQQEEDLLRKLHAADEDYHSRVDVQARERAELLATGRPEIIKSLQDIIHECDGGMVLQVQKYASFSEKLLLSNGLCISPIKSAQKPDARSLREVVLSVDMEKDLNHYLATFRTRVPPKSSEPKYERHAVLGGPTTTTTSSAGPGTGPGAASTTQLSAAAPPRLHTSSHSMSQPTGLAQNPYNDSLMSPQTSTPVQPAYGSVGASSGRYSPALGGGGGATSDANRDRSFSYSGFGQQGRPTGSGAQPPLQQSQPLQVRNSVPPGGTAGGAAGSSGMIGDSSTFSPSPMTPATPASRYYNNAAGASYPSASQGPPQLGALPFQSAGGSTMPTSTTSSSLATSVLQSPQQSMPSQPAGLQPAASLSGGGASKPVFGVPLETLYDRDGLAVPMVVYQCIQAVDLFGLTVEGIYRLSGSLPHVNKLKSMFDTDTSSPKLDFRNPENFYHDVNSVAGLLKQFFRDLPDPLLTRQHYDRFIEAAQHDDATVRRDSLHAVINDLPDPNYATLRALVLHLNRVVENVSVTRMTSQNLAIVFGPTLMGAGGMDAEKGRWHVRVIDTILQNTYQIFDED